MDSFKRQLTSALVLNLCLKVFTFTLSTTLTRLLSPEESGVGFSYAIYTETVLFLAREAVRNVAARQPLDSGENATGKTPNARRTATQVARRGEAVRQILYLGFLALPISLLVMMVMESQALFGISLFPCLLNEVYPTMLFNMDDFFPFLPPSAAIKWSPMFSFCLVRLPHFFVWCSVLITLFAEPCLVLSQCLGSFSRVVVSEFVTLVARLLIIIFFARNSPIQDAWQAQVFFAFGYLGASVVHFCYWIFTCRPPRQGQLQRPGQPPLMVKPDPVHQAVEDSYAPPPPPSASEPPPTRARTDLPCPLHCFVTNYFPGAARRHAALLLTFGRESVLRLVLSEGEKFTLTVFGSATARGHYELISHLGSLVARLVFRVWENACGVQWSQLVASGRGADAVRLLSLMLRLATSVGLAFPLLGPPLATHFLSTLYSARWSSPAMVSALQWFCLVVPCMAVNGLLEAFLRATATAPTLRRLQTCMVVESVLYMLACYVVLGTTVWDDVATHAPLRWLGAVEKGSVVPLVGLNLVNMLSRIARSIVLILLDSRMQKQIKHKAQEKGATTHSAAASQVEAGAVATTAVVVPASVFTRMVRPAFGVAVVALFVVTRLADSLVVTLLAMCLYPILAFALDDEVRQTALRLLRSRHGVPDTKKNA